MRNTIPFNNVNFDYNYFISSFIDSMANIQGNNIKSIILAGSYARGEATESSDVDIWCVFDKLDTTTLTSIATIINNLPIKYGQVELNTQCFSFEEFNSIFFADFLAKPIIVLEGVLLYGEEIAKNGLSNDEVVYTYKKILSQVLLSVRHYISVNEPKEKLTYRKLKAYVLKPLMFALRLERYCNTGIYPLTSKNLYDLYNDMDKSVLVIWYMSPDTLEKAIQSNHIDVLLTINNYIADMINN